MLPIYDRPVDAATASGLHRAFRERTAPPRGATVLALRVTGDGFEPAGPAGTTIPVRRVPWPFADTLRFADLTHLATNVAGALLGALFARWLRARLRRHGGELPA